MMPTSSSLESSFSIIKHSYVMASGYLQQSLLSLLHLFIICLKHLLTYINACVLIAKHPSQAFTAHTVSSRLPKRICQVSDLNPYVREKVLTSWHFNNPCAQSTFLVQLCCHMRCSWCGHRSLLVKNQLGYFCTYDFLWYFGVIRAGLKLL